MQEGTIKRLNSNVVMRKELGIYVAYYSKQAITINTHIAEFRKAKKKALTIEHYIDGLDATASDIGEVFFDEYKATEESKALLKEELNEVKHLNERRVTKDIILFKRARSNNWQAKLKLHTGKWKDYSTKTDNFDEGKAWAEEKLRDIRYRQETGKVAVTKRFKDVCAVAKRELDTEYKRTKKPQAKDKARVIKIYLIPLLGKYYTHRITAEVLAEFEEQREEMIGRQLTKSTINTHNSALNYCFELARRHNYISEIPKLYNFGKKNRERRVFFNDKEYRKLTAFMWREVERAEKRINTDGFDIRSYETQAMLRDIVLILANTGIRCGNELLNLRWCDVAIRKHKDVGEYVVFSLLHTKTKKPREVISYEAARKVSKNTQKTEEIRSGSFSCLERIKNRFEDLKKKKLENCFKSTDYIFRLPSTNKVVRQDVLSKNFRKWLEKTDLLVDSLGEDRTLYSLRHTYASRRRFDGMSFEDLALNMGTSVTLLQKVYSQFKQDEAPSRFTGHYYRELKEKLQLKT